MTKLFPNDNNTNPNQGRIVNIVICCSGQGSNFERLVLACQNKEIPGAKITGLIIDRPCPAADRAEKLNVSWKLVAAHRPLPDESWDARLLQALIDFRADVILLAGFLKKIGPLVLAQYPHRILNIHPSLLPKFGGPGMYGRKVHEEVLKAGVKESGVSVHLVDAQYDHGPVIYQERIALTSSETAASLEARIHQLEHAVYPKALLKFLASPANNQQ